MWYRQAVLDPTDEINDQNAMSGPSSIPEGPDILYHYTFGAFDPSDARTSHRGLFYLSPTIEGAARGGEGGYREGHSPHDDAWIEPPPAGIIMAYRLNPGVRLFENETPISLSEPEYAALADRRKKIETDKRMNFGRKSAEDESARLNFLRLLYFGRPSSINDDATLLTFRAPSDIFGMKLSHSLAEDPSFQRVLKEEGYDGACVFDEGGRSVATFDPATSLEFIGSYPYEPSRDIQY